MIVSLRGVVVSKDLGSVVVESSGVGREVHVTASTASRLPVGAEAFLLVVPSYAMYGGGETLYGFFDASEKALFTAFRDEIPATGAKKALEYLEKASKSLPDFRRAVIDRDEKLLCGVFGFTKKTAAKLLDALKGKLEDVRVPGAPHIQAASQSVPASGPWAQALNALASLGYRPAEVRQTLQSLAEEHGGKDLPAEQLVRQALKRL